MPLCIWVGLARPTTIVARLKFYSVMSLLNLQGALLLTVSWLFIAHAACRVTTTGNVTQAAANIIATIFGGKSPVVAKCELR